GHRRGRRRNGAPLGPRGRGGGLRVGRRGAAPRARAAGGDGVSEAPRSRLMRKGQRPGRGAAYGPEGAEPLPPAPGVLGVSSALTAAGVMRSLPSALMGSR